MDENRKLLGKVAMVFGGSRGIGAAIVRRLAEDGADVALTYVSAANKATESVEAAEATGRKALAIKADSADAAAIRGAVAQTHDRFGRLDIVVVNAGIAPPGAPVWLIPEAEWDDVIDVNLKGVWNTACAVVPSMIERGQGGSIIITASAAGLTAAANLGDYNASKHGAIGLGRTLAQELAPHRIRVNVLAPGAVGTPMMLNDALYRLFCPDMAEPTMEDAKARLVRGNPMGIPWLEAVDIANAALWLASDESRYVTGVVIPLDAGALG